MNVLNTSLYSLALLIVILSQGLDVKAQIQSGNGLYTGRLGLGRSTPKCVDRDFDGYGTGPQAILVTTSTGAVSPGTNSLALTSTSATFTGVTVSGSVQVAISNGFASHYDFQVGMGISGPSIPAGTIIVASTQDMSHLTISHNATSSSTQTLTVTLTSGIIVTVGTGQVMERVPISSVAGNSITGPFLYPHSSGAMVKTLGCAGPDADDYDPLRWTTAQILSLYGTIPAFLAKHGRDLSMDNPIPADHVAAEAAVLASYTSPHAIWYVAPSPAVPPNTVAGSNSNSGTDAAHPLLNLDGLSAHGYTSGDLVLARQGWNNATNSQAFIPANGTATLYTTLMSYPGERAVFDTAVGGASNINLVATVGSPHDYLIFDGISLQNGSTIGGGTNDGSGSVLVHHILFTNMEGGTGGTGESSIDMKNGLQYITLEDSALHDNDCAGGGCQHGIYWGCRDIACSNIMLRRSIAWGNDYNGFTFNGRCSACIFDKLVSYSNGVSGLTLEQGVINSTITNFLTYNNANNGLNLQTYPGDCVSQGGTGNICPYNQTGNLFENITVYQTGNANVATPGNGIGSNCPSGIPFCGQSGIAVNNTTSPLTGSLGNNTFRNIFVSSYGWLNHYPPVIYQESPAFCDSTCLGWLSTSTFNNIVAYQTDGNGGTGIFGIGASAFGYIAKTCSDMTSLTTITSCSSNIDPIFNTEGISLWNSDESYDFRLSPTSPLIHTGTATGVSVYDLAGIPHFSPPSIGALEVAPNYIWTNYLTQTLQSVAPPVGGGQYSATATSASNVATLTLSGSYFSAHGNQAMAGQNIAVSGCSNPSYNYSSVAITGFTSNTVSYTVPGAPGAATGCVVGMSTDGSVGNYGAPYDYVNKNVSVIHSWGSGFMSSTGHLIMSGGGHSDYGGNEIYDYNMNTNTISRLTVPSVITAAQFNASPTYMKNNDGTWASRHILGAWSYMPSVGKLLSFGGGTYGTNGTSGFQDTWLMDPATGILTQQDPVNCPTTCGNTVGGYVNYYNPAGGGASVDGYSAYDPNTQTVILDIGHISLLQYTPCTGSNATVCNSYKLLAGISVSGCSTGQNCQSQFIDDVNKNFWIFGAGVVKYFNIDGSPVNSIVPTIDASCNGVFNQPAPGIVWDHDNAVARMYSGTGNDQTVYNFDPVTGSCTQSLYGGATPPATTNATGTYGRWQAYTPFNGPITYVWIGDNTTGASILAPQAGCRIVPTTLPSGTIGVPYPAQTFTNIGCSAGTWSLSGLLPIGITGCSSGSGSTCAISGTPTQTGTFNFTISYSTASDPLTITIVPAPGRIFLPTLIK